MLIKIDKSVIDKWSEDNSDEITSVLENLATAEREGKHKIIANRNTLEQIISNAQLFSSLSFLSQRIYKEYLLKNIAEFRNYERQVSTYIEISTCLGASLKQNSSGSIIQLPYRCFTDSKMTQETILLCENLEDTDFYKKIGDVYLHRESIRNKLIKFEPRGGGGSTIASEYENIKLAKNRLCLCIVDSDRIAPQCKLGSTAKKIFNLEEKNKNILTTKLFILDVREIENLIPCTILEKILNQHQNREKACQILQLINNHSLNEITKFIDHKKGSQLIIILEDEQDTSKKYWQEQINKVSQISQFSEYIDFFCVENWKCQQQKKDECKCYIALDFGQKILEDAIKYIEDLRLAKLSSLIDDFIYPEWQKIAEEIVSWCFAGSPVRG